MAGRSEARRLVLQMLYLVDQNPDADLSRIETELRRGIQEPAARDFAFSLLRGILAARQELDELIRHTATNWRLERMAPTDRNVLRMGLYELIKLGTPPSVAINEAVEIAREFGTENSSAFVNGILDKLIPTTAAESTGSSET